MAAETTGRLCLKCGKEPAVKTYCKKCLRMLRSIGQFSKGKRVYYVNGG